MLRERIKQFIVENFYVPDPSLLQEETSLIDEGYVDSTGMLEVIAFLETEYGVTVGDTEMTPENLETIGRIERFMARKRQAQSAGDVGTVKAT